MSACMTELQWERAVGVATNMLKARGYEVVTRSPIRSDDDEADELTRGWWLVGRVRKSAPGTACHALDCTESSFLFIPSTGCVGKSIAKTILSTITSEFPLALEQLGQAALVHSSRLSTDAMKLMEDNHVQVFSGAELQFDRLQLLRQRGILKNVVVRSKDEVEDADRLRRWLTTDPMSKYFGVPEDMVLSWTTGEDRRRALIVPPPPFNI